MTHPAYDDAAFRAAVAAVRGVASLTRDDFVLSDENDAPLSRDARLDHVIEAAERAAEPCLDCEVGEPHMCPIPPARQCPTCVHAEGYDRLSGPCPTCHGTGVTPPAEGAP